MATTKRAPAKRAGAKKTTAKKATAKKATAKKATAKKATVKKATPKKSTAKKSSTGKTAPRKSATKTPAKKSATKRATKSAASYTDPALRERLKARIMRGTKGGKAGQWSARKAQLLAHEYEAEGGGYRGGRSAQQQHLHGWTEEQWTTSDGKPAKRAGGTTRYLPKKAWTKLSSGQRAATNRKKVEGSRRGRQHVANTAPAKRARRAATS